MNPTKTLKALSIQQPWSWLIANGHKDIENRDWHTSYRGQILIHAGKKGDLYYFSGDHFHSKPFETLLALCLDRIPNFPGTGAGYERGGIVGIATLADVVTHSTSPWFRGIYGFVLKDARPLRFVPLRGQQGIFDVDASLIDLSEVRA